MGRLRLPDEEKNWSEILWLAFWFFVWLASEIFVATIFVQWALEMVRNKPTGSDLTECLISEIVVAVFLIGWTVVGILYLKAFFRFLKTGKRPHTPNSKGTN